MLTVKKAISVILTVMMLISTVSVGATVGAASCNHNIGEEYDDSTMIVYATKEGTCASEGFIGYTCTVCSHSVVYTLDKNPDNHTMSQWKVETEPTCKEEGLKSRYCLNCFYPETENIPVTDEHTYPDEATLDFWWQQEGITIGSQYNGWTILTLPTCISEGSAEIACTTCGNAKKSASLALHSYSFIEAETIAATCVREGECKVYCDACNANYTLTIPVDENNHVIAWETVEEPTCTSEGTQKQYCLYHGDFEGAETNALEKLEHSFNNYVYNNDATCTEDGTESSECDSCTETHTRIAEGTKTHCITKWHFISGNCTEGGRAYIDCLYQNCQVDYVEIKEIAPGEHPNLLTRIVAPTCTEYGYTLVECPDCGFSSEVSGTQVSAKGHSYNWVTVQAGSCIPDDNGNTTPEITVGTCSCGDSVTKESDVEHSYVTVTPAVDATCTKNGATAELRCLNCEKVVSAQVIPSSGHNDADSNGCCDICYSYFVTSPDGEEVDCSCICHNNDGIAKFLVKIYMFFCRIFGSNQICDCGNLHYEKSGLFPSKE